MATVEEYTKRYLAKYGKRPSTADGAAIVERAYIDKYGKAPSGADAQAVKDRAHREFAEVSAPKPVSRQTMKQLDVFGFTQPTPQKPSGTHQKPNVKPQAVTGTQTRDQRNARQNGDYNGYGDAASAYFARTLPKAPKGTPKFGRDVKTGETLKRQLGELGGSFIAMGSQAGAHQLLGATPAGSPGYNQALKIATDPVLAEKAKAAQQLSAIGIAVPALGAAAPATVPVMEMLFGLDAAKNTYQGIRDNGGFSGYLNADPMGAIMNGPMMLAGLHGGVKAMRGGLAGVPDVTGLDPSLLAPRPQSYRVPVIPDTARVRPPAPPVAPPEYAPTVNIGRVRTERTAPVAGRMQRGPLPVPQMGGRIRTEPGVRVPVVGEDAGVGLRVNVQKPTVEAPVAAPVAEKPVAVASGDRTASATISKKVVAASPEAQQAELDRLLDYHGGERLVEGDESRRVVFGVKKGQEIDLNAPERIGYEDANSDLVGGLHTTGDTDYWARQLGNDYEQYAGKKPRIIRIRHKEGDIRVDDPQFSFDPESGGTYRPDTSVFLGAKRKLKYGRDWVFEGEKFTDEVSSHIDPWDLVHKDPEYRALLERAATEPMESPWWDETLRPAEDRLLKKYSNPDLAPPAAEPVKAPVGVEAPVETPNVRTSNPNNAAKEPWEMTREEWGKAHSEASKAENKAFRVMPGSPAQDAVMWGTSERIRLDYGAEPVQRTSRSVPVIIHRSVIAKALKEGKPVPPEVLADYPDLVPAPQPPVAQGGEKVAAGPSDRLYYGSPNDSNLTTELGLDKVGMPRPYPERSPDLLSEAQQRAMIDENKALSERSLKKDGTPKKNANPDDLARMRELRSIANAHNQKLRQFNKDAEAWSNERLLRAHGFTPGQPVEVRNPVTGEWEAGTARTYRDSSVQVQVGGSGAPYGFSAKDVRAAPSATTKGKPVLAPKQPVKPRASRKGQSNSSSPARTGAIALPRTQTNAVAATKPAPVVRASDIVADLDKAFAPIRTGRIRNRRALGIFKIKQAVVRSRKANDLPTIAHEVGHAMEKMLWPDRMTPSGKFSQKVFPKEYADELKPLDYDFPKKKRVHEGYAEFIRHYLTDPVRAKQLAPKFHAFFETELAKHPQVKAALSKAQGDIGKFIAQSDKIKVHSTISYDNPKPKTDVQTVWNRAYQVMVDELDPLRRAESAITKGKEIPSEQSAFKEAWRGRGVAGKSEEWIHHGITDETGKRIPGPAGDSLKERLKPVANEIEDFSDYAVARHALDVIDTLGSQAMPLPRASYKAVVDAAPAHYQQVLKRLVEYQDRNLDELVKSGMLSPKAKAEMRKKWPNHVPLYRDFSVEPRGMGKGTANLTSPIKRLKGSGRDILPPIESIIKDTFAMHNIAQKNRVMVKLTDLADAFDDSGRIVEKVSANMKPTSLTLEDILQGDKHMLGTELGDASASGIDVEAVRTMFRPNVTGSKTENIVVVYKNGKPVLYQLDPGLYDAVTATDAVSLGVLEKFLSPATATAHILRAGATLTPEFAVRNPMRDIMTALVNSDYGLTPVDWLRGLFSTVKRTDLYHQFKASGAAHASMVSLDRNYLGNSVRQVKNRTVPEHVIDFVSHPMDALRALGELTEEATRVSEFGKGTKWGKETNIGKVIDSVVSSRDVTVDFSRSGIAGKKINRVTAFFNAAVQGADKTARVFKDHPGRSTLKATAWITAPTVALYAINRNNKKYQDLPEWEKDMFWHIPTPNDGPLIRIPRPFELGVVFGALPERILRWIDAQDPHAFDGFAETMKGQLPNILPTIVQPAWDIHGNKSFTGAPIIPRGEQYAPPQLQTGPNTSTTAKVIGKAINQSPRNVDYAIRGYTGGLGKMAVDLVSDPLLNAVGGSETKLKPSKPVTEWPGVKAFFVSPYTQSASVERMYNERQKLSDKKALAKAGGPKMSVTETSRLAALESGAKSLSELRKLERQIQSENDPTGLYKLISSLGIDTNAKSLNEIKRMALIEIKKKMGAAADAATSGM